MKKFLIFILLIVLNFPTTLIFAETLSNQTISEVNEAISKGLVPKELQGNYSQDITMGEFCKLCTAVIKVWNNNIKYDENMSFLDISDKDILFCIENEITNTIENNKLVPDNPITRQEAAKMLYNTLLVGTNVIQEKHSSEKTPECCIPHSFDDGGKIKSWARNEINHMYRYGVMFGVDDKNYNPDRNCTREQAICAFLRLYNCKYDISKNPVPGSDYYPYGEFAQYYCPDNNVDSNGDYYYFDTEQTKYIDSKGNIYNWEEKGFVYPFYTKYIVYNKNGPGMGSYYKILDKDGNNLIGDCRSIDLKDNFILCKYDEYSEKSEIYDISDKNISFEDSLVLQNDNLISYKGDGLFNIYDENRSFIGIFDINNPSVVKYNRKEYYEKSKNASLIKYNDNIYKDEANKYASSFNNIFTLKNTDETYFIIKNNKSEFEILKQFKMDSPWKFQESVGSNIVFQNSETGKYILYRGVSGLASAEYDYIKVLYNNEAVASDGQDSEIRYYILNADGTVKLDLKKFAYKGLEPVYGFNFYKIYNDVVDNYIDRERNTLIADRDSECDIIDKNGNVILKGINGTLFVDKSGILCNRYENNITFFDFFGDKLGEFDLNNLVRNNNDTYTNIHFINGLLYVNITDTSNDKWKSIGDLYITPYGKILK